MSKKGFTLVELAIVLVIIGLLVGGVLQGQELIKQAQIRNVISKFNQFDAAVNTFRAKYDQLPGDFSKASDFLIDSADASSTKNVAASAGSSGNGDNNGVLADGLGGTSTVAFSGEIANFWVHLSNTGLIKGSYAQPAALACVAAGTSCTSSPAGKAYPDSVVGSAILALSTGSKLYYALGVGTNISTALGAATGAAAATSARGDNLTPEEAYSIDGKLDNGVPNTGAVMEFEGYSTAGVFDTTIASYTTSTCSDDATTPYAYNVSLTTKVCTIRIKASS